MANLPAQPSGNPIRSTNANVPEWHQVLIAGAIVSVVIWGVSQYSQNVGMLLVFATLFAIATWYETHGGIFTSSLSAVIGKY